MLKIGIKGVKALQGTLTKVSHTIDNKNKLKEIINKLAAATPVDTGRAANGWVETDAGIINEVEYISELNAGSSKQAPAHFVEKVIVETNGIKPNGSIVEYR